MSHRRLILKRTGSWAAAATLLLAVYLASMPVAFHLLLVYKVPTNSWKTRAVNAYYMPVT